MSHKLRFLLLMLAAVIVVVVLRVFFFSIITIPGDGEEPTLLAGDRVLVNRWSYGYRTPLSTVYGYHRWKESKAHRGQWIVFNRPGTNLEALPDTSELFISQCIAEPGDTVWLGARGNVSSRCSYANGQIWPLVVPAKNKYVKMTPWNVRLYATIIQQHEEKGVEVHGDSLFVDGRHLNYYRFAHDYYWMQNAKDDNYADSRTLGFIPQESLFGKVRMVLYSLDAGKPWFKRWLWSRMGLFVTDNEK